jgi:hypothetical protein
MHLYIHKDVGKERKTISGYYTYIEEKQMNIQGRDVLYAVGVGIVDNSCCGVGGCLFIEIPGYIVAWKSDVDEEGHSISCIDSIELEEEKNRIKQAIHELYPNAQVRFGP